MDVNGKILWPHVKCLKRQLYMLYLVPPCCTYRCYMIIYYIQKAHVLGISKWRSFPAAEKLVLMLKEFAQNDLYKSSCEWMTWKSKQILTTPFFMGRGLRNLELLSGVLNRHLFVRYRPYFLGGGVSITGAIITAGDFFTSLLATCGNDLTGSCPP